MTASVGTALLDVEVNRRLLESDIDKAGKAAGSRLGGAIGSSMGTALAAVGVGALVKNAFAEAEDAQRTSARTDSALKSTGNAAGVTADQIANLGSELGDLAAVDNDVVQAGENVLLTFTKVRNVGADRIFDDATLAALNMSTALETDLQGAIIQVGKALNDPIKGVTALRRVGVSFTEQQQEQIKAMVESGHLLDAQKLILGELETEFGGAAESMVTDGARARVAFADLQESIGTALYPAMTLLSQGVSEVASGFGSLPPPVQTATLIAGAGAAVWSRYGTMLASAGSKAVQLAKELIVPKGAVDGLGSSAESSAAGLTKMQGATILAGTAAAGIIGVYQAVSSEIDKSNQRVQEAADRVKAMGDTSTYAGIESQLENLASQYQTTYGILEDESNKVLPNPFVMDEGTEILDQLSGQYEALKKQRGEVDRLAKRYGLTRDEVVKYGSEHAIVMHNVETATRRGGIGPIGDLRTEIEKATGALSPLMAEFEKAMGLNLDPQEQAIQVVAAQQKLNASLRENGNTFDIQTEAGRANREAYIAGKKSILEYADALIQSGVPLDEVQRKVNGLIGDLGDSAVAAGATEDQVHALNGELGLTPERVDIAFNVPGLKDAVTDMQRLNAEWLLNIELRRQQDEKDAQHRRLAQQYGITDNGGDLTPHGRSGVNVHGNVYVDAKDKPASEIGREIDRQAVRRMIR